MELVREIRELSFSSIKEALEEFFRPLIQAVRWMRRLFTIPTILARGLQRVADLSITQERTLAVVRNLQAETARLAAELHGLSERVHSLNIESPAQAPEAVGAESLAEIYTFPVAYPLSPATLVGRSPVMSKIISIIDRIAPTDSSVLITGDAGTGKELVARAIHDRSPRRNEPFVEVNCSAVPETLIEALLFGHSGYFEKANGGVIFLDAVDALNLTSQAKLLRVLQERTGRRIGSRMNIPLDVRVISATTSDLANAVAMGRFRPDLYYRLRVLPLHLPALRERKEDVELLVAHFLHRHEKRIHKVARQFSADAMQVLIEYDWPGNVRELENAIQYALAISDEQELIVADLPPEIVRRSQDLARMLGQLTLGEASPLAEIERGYILELLQRFGGNQEKTAEALGIYLSAVRVLREQQLKTG
jgi:DNA-binding NtrC family response regulator